MKAFVLIGRTASGELKTVAEQTSAPVLAAAAAARASGKLGGAAIVEGVVLSTIHAGPLKQFRVALQKPAKK